LEITMLRAIPPIQSLLVLTIVLAFVPAARVGAHVATPSGVSPSTPSALSGRFSGLVDIGDRSLWLSCLGEGSPTVILESGSPFMGAGDWYGVQADVAEVTHVCAYDRANVGSSDPAPAPRSVQQMAEDLDALLTAAGIPGPYVLAPFSFGPWVTRIYASQHPENVAGLALIDPEPLGLEARWKAILPAELSARWIEDYWNGNPEGIDFAASETQLEATNPLPAVPLLVLAHTPGMGDYLIPSGWPIDVLDPIWQELVAAQAQEVPGGRLIVAEASSHGMAFTSPEVVVDAVLQVVAAVRDPSTWAMSATPGAATPAP
jgi:pimeloyl-ACP methyl ester carboxylesterase